MIPQGRPARRGGVARWPVPLVNDDCCLLVGSPARDIRLFLSSWEQIEHWFRIRTTDRADLVVVGPATQPRDVRMISREIDLDGLAMRARLACGGVHIETYMTLRSVSAKDWEHRLVPGTEVWVHAEFDPGASPAIPSLFRSVTSAGLRAMHAELST